MKKILLTLLSVSAATAALAQGIGLHGANLPLQTNDYVTRAVARAQAQPAWQTQLKQLQHAFKQFPKQIPGALPVVHHDVLSYQHEKIYLQRLVQLQKSIQGNQALAGFLFVAPIPADLATLSPDNYATLHAFLKDTQTAYTATRTEYVRPFTLALHLKGKPLGNIEVWVDVPTRHVYLMSDNFYTTSAGKYGLHLK